MIRTIENNRDSIICSPELIAYENNWISKEDLEKSSKEMIKNSYGKKLSKILENKDNN